MASCTPRHHSHALFGAALLSSALLSGSVVPRAAHAELGPCGSDPVIVLSNGATIDLSTAIDATEADVRQVSYTLHTPVGTRVVTVAATSGALGPKEDVQVSADNAPNVYDSVTTVRTTTAGIAVMTTMTVLAPRAPAVDATASASAGTAPDATPLPTVMTGTVTATSPTPAGTGSASGYAHHPLFIHIAL